MTTTLYWKDRQSDGMTSFTMREFDLDQLIQSIEQSENSMQGTDALAPTTSESNKQENIYKLMDAAQSHVALASGGGPRKTALLKFASKQA